MIGLYWLSKLGLDAGTTYLWLFIIGVIFIVITAIAKFLVKLDFWYEIPINKTSERGVLMFFVGIIFISLMFSISSFSNLNFYSPFIMAPLGFGSVMGGVETFTALQAATSPFWNFFISVISASVIEEIVLGWGFVAIGSLALGYGLRYLLKLDFGDGNKYWDFAMAITFSMILFTVLHVFNRTYFDEAGNVILGSFMFAALFRGGLNILIYKLGNFGLLFGIGAHSTNNFINLLVKPIAEGGIGLDGITKALFSFPGGIILIAIFIILLIFAFFSIKKIMREGYGAYKDFVTDFE